MENVYFMKDKYGRKDFYVLRRNWSEMVEWGCGASVPEGSFPMEIVGERTGATGYHIVFDEERKTYVREYVALAEDDPRVRPPRTFSKLKVVAALIEAKLWPTVKAWIEGSGLYDLYLAAQDFSEADPYFTRGKAELMAALGLDEATVESILSQCVAEDR